MKNKLLLILCLVLAVTFAFASCGDTNVDGGDNGGVNAPTGNNGGTNNGETNNGGSGNQGGGDCTHTFSENWSTNETHHWHAATCEHGENRDSYAEHTDSDEDGFCDSCEYEVGHEHTYASEWKYDVNNHWNEATCTHTGEIGHFEPHADNNSDAKCDSCEAHVHVLSTSGMCRGCGEQVKVIDNSDLSSVISSLVDHRNNVSGGRVTTGFIGRFNNSAQSTKSNKIVEYLYGNNSAYYKIASAVEVQSTDREGNYYEASTSDVLEKWQSLEADDTVFGVSRETVGSVVGEFEVDGGANTNTLSGYYFSVSTLASGYGAEGILKALYERTQQTGASDFVYEESDGHYKFSFNYLAINSTSVSDASGNSAGIVHNVNYFVVTVEFDYTENYELTKLSITCDCYTNDAGSNDNGDMDVDNIDLDYAALTGKIELTPGAKSDTYTFTVEQTVGERTFVNEYDKEYFSPKGFLVYSDKACTTACPDTITVSLSGSDKYARFYLQDSEGMKFTTSTAEGLEWATSDEDGLSAKWPIVGTAFSFQDSSVRFLAKKVGSYTVTFTYQGITKTFTVNVVN